MLLSKTVIVKWNKRYRKYYVEKGYPFTNYGDEFKVKVEDLPNGSNVKVDVKCDCDDCNNPYLKPMTFQNYNKNIHKDGKYYCKKCAIKLYGYENTRKSKLKNSISFYDWCYNNLPKEEADKIMERWDYELNIKNGKILSPKDISYSSNGFKQKGYWFKCAEHIEHKSELKSISHFVSGRKRSLNCNKCNTISITHPELIKYLVNKDDVYKYSYGSTKSISMICPDCGYEKKIGINTLINQGFTCPRCSDGKSFPEKFMFIFLEQLLNKYFQAQLSRKSFTWCGNYKYDFYIDNITCIIETHGLQHYEETKSNWNNLKEIQQNDILKEKLAKYNGIKNYIVIDCRYSELEWIKNSIMNSELPILLNFKEEDIDWLKCHKYACNSLVKKVCELWNSGININQIAEIFKLYSNSIRRYLKKGTKLGWCNYVPKKEMIKNQSKLVICLNTKEIFNSILEASKKYNTYDSSISTCCKGKIKSSGKHPITGEKLRWMYYDDYLKTI